MNTTPLRERVKKLTQRKYTPTEKFTITYILGIGGIIVLYTFIKHIVYSKTK